MTGKLLPLLGALVGGILGWLGALYATRAAEAAVKVRPDLATVSWLDALLASHFTDWLFYNHPTAGVVVYVILGALTLGFMGWLA